jgi:hypothetical protein
MKYNLSVIIPGIRNSNWENIFNQLEKSVGKYTFELICVGPYFPPQNLENNKNFRYIRDFGNPSRCFQIGSNFINSDYICWVPDDSIILENSLQNCLDFMYEQSKKEDCMCLKYSEGIGHTGNQDKDESYWISSTHEDQRLPQIDPNWKIAPLFLCNSETFCDLGGVDCRFEHLNLNTHDFMYRIQKLGGTIHGSPCKILSVDWNPGQDVITQAHFENDVPLLKEMYDSDEFPRIVINIDNWKVSPSVWQRRFKN